MLFSDGLDNQAFTVIENWTAPAWVNEFYKKGCQEKSSAWSGGARLFLEIQPTLFRYPGRGLACDPFLVRFLSSWWQSSSMQDTASRMT
ncbi:MAG: hypothetical protein WCC16_02185, partial [Candidatus Sulfotelmatobacter sp.]